MSLTSLKFFKFFKNEKNEKKFVLEQKRPENEQLNTVARPRADTDEQKRIKANRRNSLSNLMHTFQGKRPIPRTSNSYSHQAPSPSLSKTPLILEFSPESSIETLPSPLPPPIPILSTLISPVIESPSPTSSSYHSPPDDSKLRSPPPPKLPVKSPLRLIQVEANRRGSFRVGLDPELSKLLASRRGSTTSIGSRRGVLGYNRGESSRGGSSASEEGMIGLGLETTLPSVPILQPRNGSTRASLPNNALNLGYRHSIATGAGTGINSSDFLKRNSVDGRISALANHSNSTALPYRPKIIRNPSFSKPPADNTSPKEMVVRPTVSVATQTDIPTLKHKNHILITPDHKNSSIWKDLLSKKDLPLPTLDISPAMEQTFRSYTWNSNGKEVPNAVPPRTQDFWNGEGEEDIGPCDVYNPMRRIVDHSPSIYSFLSHNETENSISKSIALPPSTFSASSSSSATPDLYPVVDEASLPPSPSPAADLESSTHRLSAATYRLDPPLEDSISASPPILTHSSSLEDDDDVDIDPKFSPLEATPDEPVFRPHLRILKIGSQQSDERRQSGTWFLGKDVEVLPKGRISKMSWVRGDTDGQD